MEEIGATIPKYQPLQVLWRPFPPDSLITQELVISLFEESITRISSAILLIRPYKVLPFTSKNFTRQSFFLSFIFIAHFFMGLWEFA